MINMMLASVAGGSTIRTSRIRPSLRRSQRTNQRAAIFGNCQNAKVGTGPMKEMPRAILSHSMNAMTGILNTQSEMPTR
jgi:hypothetical protein